MGYAFLEVESHHQKSGSGVDSLGGFKRHFVLAGSVMLVFEILFVILPLYLLSPAEDFASERIKYTAPAFLLMQLIWWGVMAYWMRPLYVAVSAKRKGEPINSRLAEKAYRMTWLQPIYALALRFLLWIALAFLHGFLFVKLDGWEEHRTWQVVSIVALHGLAATSIRCVWYARLFKTTRVRFLPHFERLRHFANRYFSEIFLAIVFSCSATAAALAAFVYFFLPITVEEYFNIQVIFAPFALVVILVVTLVAAQLRRVLDAYLATQLKIEVRMSGVVSAATDVYRRAQSLPYLLAAIHMVMWAVVGCVMGWMVRQYWKLEFDDSALLAGIVLVIGIGTSLYQALGHRWSLRELLDHITYEHRMPIRGIRTALSLRVKLLIYFGGMVLFAVGLSSFWALLQYKNVVSKYSANQTQLGLAWVRSEMQAALGTNLEKPEAAQVVSVLETLGGRSADTIVYYIPDSPSQDDIAIGGGIDGVPELPWYIRAQIRHTKDQSVQLKAYSLAGKQGRLVIQWQGEGLDLGGVAIFHPTYTGRGAQMVRPLQELVIFFIILFGACAGIVLVSIGQFVAPIRRLEARAEEMARGELSMPVLSGGEGDEVGRLTYAMESMRKALSEKIRTTEESKQDLEKAVEMRTSDLAQRNKELAETLGKLTHAQDQLIRSEKMASIGQLVAGIAHEINNPVNAIVNTVGPLEETILEIKRSPDKDSEQGLDESLSDAKDMIRVVKRGAERTKAIVKALHNYSRTDDEHISNVHINASLQESLELLKHVVLFDIDVVEKYTEVGAIRGLAGKLGQVFLNLLTNAAQALPDKGQGRIEVQTKRGDEDLVEIKIIDNGKGIPAHLLPKIFDPFFTTKDVGEGTGLGLSIVHGIVERHGGKIDVESKLGVGTTFTIRLPRAYDQLSMES